MLLMDLTASISSEMLRLFSVSLVVLSDVVPVLFGSLVGVAFRKHSRQRAPRTIPAQTSMRINCLVFFFISTNPSAVSWFAFLKTVSYDTNSITKCGKSIVWYENGSKKEIFGI